MGGLERGGSYLVLGAPGPAKMVACLQFLHTGLGAGESCLLITSADADDILEVGAAWGFDMRDAWRDGRLQIIGFRDDFELRAIRSIEPLEVLEELDTLIGVDADRIAVDPGSMFLTGGARTVLGSAFLAWADRRSATVLTTFPIDADATELPPSADWLVNATTARLVLRPDAGGIYRLGFSKARPGVDEREQSLSVALEPREGLVRPTSFPARRGSDRVGVDHNRLLLVSLGDSHASDLETWAEKAFESDIVAEPYEAVAKVQGASGHGCVLVHAPRTHVREAVQACRALRPLTPAAIVFASDDAIRSTDRVSLLEAGADDCLTGALDFRELGVRIRQAMASGARPALARNGSERDPFEGLASDDGRVTRAVFVSEVSRRADDPNLTFFCVLDVSANGVDASVLEKDLAGFVRSEEGDIVSAADRRCLVLLQGARAGQLGAFLTRVETQLRDRTSGSELTIDVLSHPSDARKIEALLGTAGGEAD